MKAEHRKELQTNSLADMLGRTVRNVRGGTGVSWTKIIIAFVLVAGVFIFFWLWNNRARSNAELWVKLNANTSGSLRSLISENEDTNPGKAALMTLMFERLYGMIGYLGQGSDLDRQTKILEIIKETGDEFGSFAKKFDDDPELQAEARYGQAVATEAMAISDIKNLDEAKKIYEELANSKIKTGFAVQAARRLDQLNDPAEFARISAFYRDFRTNAGRMPGL